MTTYVVTVQDPYDTNVKNYLQKQKFVFSEKGIEAGTVFLVEMTEQEKNTLLKKYKSATVSTPDFMCSVDDLDKNDVPFPQVTPDQPKKKYILEMAIVAVIVLGFLFIAL